LASSLLLAVLVSGLQALLDYRQAQSSIRQTIEQIRQTHAESVITALWDFNQVQVYALIEGMLHFPHISYAGVVSKGNAVAEAGLKELNDRNLQVIPLDYDYKGRTVHLGELNLQIDRPGMRREAMDRAVRSFIFLAGLIAVVALFLFWQFDRLVSRHLASAAKYFTGFDLKLTPRELRLDKRKRQDELDILVDAFNDMRADLQESYARMLGAQEEIKASEERFRTIFNSVSEAIFVLGTATGTIVDMNQSALDMWGATREEFLGQDIEALSAGVSPYGREQSQELLRGAMAGSPSTSEWLAKARDGHLFWVELSIRKAKLGEQERLLLSCRDITSRKQVEETLRKTRSFLNNILESMPSAIIGLDSSRRVTHWNRGAERVCGLEAESAMGRPLSEVSPWLGAQEASVGRAAIEERPVSLERQILTTGEETQFLDIMIYPLVANGVDGVVLRLDDVTRRVHLEEMMVQSEKMMSVGSLAGGMAHEINNPLSGILQSVQNITRRLSPDLPGNIKAAQEEGCTIEAVSGYAQRREILSFLRGIKESGERAAKIVQNMLGFIRKSSSEHVPVQISDILDRSVEIASTDYDLKKKFDFRRIEIIRDYESDMPLVPCSPMEIEQVVYNLLANAAQAMAAGGSGTGGGRIFLRLSRRGRLAVIEVEDNGPGMEEKIRRKIFEPFFSTKPPGEGTGLGLSVAYFIITANHHGAIRVDSWSGKGARFTIELPLAPQRNGSA
jgi:PAS domain S-box-containing protein